MLRFLLSSLIQTVTVGTGIAPVQRLRGRGLRSGIRSITAGQTVVMGRKTLLSLPGSKGLPNRRNIVLSRTVHDFPGCDVYTSLDEALKHCSDEEDIYIIGGANVYAQAIDRADRLCLTEIYDVPDGADAFFPEYGGWRETWREEHAFDEKHAYRFAFVDYAKS